MSSERLTLRDEEILQAVATSTNLNEARLRLHVSRSYLYARLRSIAVKLDLPSGPALVRALRVADAARERDLG
jgi:DNA-binding CsgD family transcriptional regulator